MTLTFSKCEELIKKGRGGKKKLDHNTYLETIDKDTFGVRLHATVVVAIHRNGTYTLDSGGWQTPTTKSRINDYGPCNVYQSKGIWYLPNNQVFADGCIVDSDGNRVDKKVESVEKTEKKKAALDRMVSKYIKGFVDDLMKNGLKTPSNGDCWGCLFKSSDVDQEPASGWNIKRTSVKDSEAMGFDHLISHMKEKYYVPSLLWKAICEQGYTNPGLIWQMIDLDVKKEKRPDFALRALRHYFKRRKPELMKLM